MAGLLLLAFAAATISNPTPTACVYAARPSRRVSVYATPMNQGGEHCSDFPPQLAIDAQLHLCYSLFRIIIFH